MGFESFKLNGGAPEHYDTMSLSSPQSLNLDIFVAPTLVGFYTHQGHKGTKGLGATAWHLGRGQVPQELCDMLPGAHLWAHGAHGVATCRDWILAIDFCSQRINTGCNMV